MASKPPSGDPREPDLSFSHACLKVDWAKQGLQHFEIQLREAMDFYVKTSGPRHDSETGRLIVGGPLNPAIALMAGDIIFSLRSAIDCCWMGLKRAVQADADKGTLPRADTADGVKGAVEKAAMEARFPGIGDFILDEIRPYRFGREAIWFAAKIDNWNKHNMLLLAGRSTTINNHTLVGTNPTGRKLFMSIENSVVIGEDSFVRLPTDLAIEHEHASVRVDIILQSREPVDERLLMPFLLDAYRNTAECVELFATRFGKPAA